tara:strand:- start:1806 stop:1994 length:189 start_codon:yes stop_codon:yes gene_type:complete
MSTDFDSDDLTAEFEAWQEQLREELEVLGLFAPSSEDQIRSYQDGVGPEEVAARLGSEIELS